MALFHNVILFLSGRRSHEAASNNGQRLTSPPRKTYGHGSSESRVQSGRITKNHASHNHNSAADRHPKLVLVESESTTEENVSEHGDSSEDEDNIEQEGTSDPDSPISSIESDEVEDTARSPSAIQDQKNMLMKQARDEQFSNPSEKEFNGWNETEVGLFKKMTSCGFEPLLPRSWALDFPTVPDELFVSEDADASDRPFLRSTHGSDFAACNALVKLLPVGTYVRDAIKFKTSTPEFILQRSLRQYQRWMLQDANINGKDYIDALVIESRQPDESVRDVIQRVTDKLRFLALTYQNKWEKDSRVSMRMRPAVTPTNTPSKIQAGPKLFSPDNLPKFRETSIAKDVQTEGSDSGGELLPTLYSITVAHTLTIILTYDASKGCAGEPRLIATFDFGLQDSDVWNAFAVAIVINWARNQLIRTQWQVKGERECDPDA
ncbi:hypothetical protein MMC25_004977 [Agyrium rufum]|nr:hypothetical protein [Agyrium rufum]